MRISDLLIDNAFVFIKNNIAPRGKKEDCLCLMGMVKD